MSRLVWSQDAEEDLDILTDYIAQDNIMAAITMRDEVENQIQRLIDFPLSGRIGRVEGTREMVVARTPFVVIYRMTVDIVIVRILHGAQHWPPLLG
ncbi:type II toxin-antitoxin system RelE/ParE family toxin [Agrobacterium sp. BA1120]|uniref:type II toxin-antitoxin system RelE/ParE family toxin n=1 Tax=Agrobacterium sp. BA1120 TaxID=3228927 RepID=UPI003369E5E6